MADIRPHANPSILQCTNLCSRNSKFTRNIIVVYGSLQFWLQENLFFLAIHIFIKQFLCENIYMHLHTPIHMCQTAANLGYTQRNIWRQGSEKEGQP